METGVKRGPGLSFLPTTAVLELTYRCNHGCIFCSCPWYSPAGDFAELPELAPARWCKLIDTLCRMGVRTFAFTGGEPLLKEGVKEILAHAAKATAGTIRFVGGESVTHQASPHLFLLSNGKNMNEEILALCREHAVNLSMSLPGLETFAAHTRAGVEATVVLDWFRRAKELGVRTTVGITVTRKNLHELFATISEAFLAGAESLLMNRFLPGGRGLSHAADLVLDAEQVREMLDRAEEVLEQSGRKGSVGTELPKCLVDTSRYKQLFVGTRCSAAQDFFVVGPSGHVRVCNHSTHRLEHVDRLDRLKHNPYWKRFVGRDYLPQTCAGCGQITDCDGGCREAAHICGGQVDSPDPLLSES